MEKAESSPNGFSYINFTAIEKQVLTTYTNLSRFSKWVENTVGKGEISFKKLDTTGIHVKTRACLGKC